MHVSDDLSTCTCIFVRHDAVRKPLQQPYDGPYKVHERADKQFTVDVKGKHNVISLDRLKPAHLEAPVITLCNPPLTIHTTPAEPVSTDISTRVTRSGRHVHWPKRLTF